MINYLKEGIKNSIQKYINKRLFTYNLNIWKV